MAAELQDRQRHPLHYTMRGLQQRVRPARHGLDVPLHSESSAMDPGLKTPDPKPHNACPVYAFCIHTRMCIRMPVCRYASIQLWMNVCMYLCMCICILWVHVAVLPRCWGRWMGCGDGSFEYCAVSAIT